MQILGFDGIHFATTRQYIDEVSRNYIDEKISGLYRIGDLVIAMQGPLQQQQFILDAVYHHFFKGGTHIQFKKLLEVIDELELSLLVKQNDVCFAYSCDGWGFPIDEIVITHKKHQYITDVDLTTHLDDTTAINVIKSAIDCGDISLPVDYMDLNDITKFCMVGEQYNDLMDGISISEIDEIKPLPLDKLRIVYESYRGGVEVSNNDLINIRHLENFITRRERLSEYLTTNNGRWIIG